MAILLDFYKVREDAQEVEYAFGAMGTANRTMVVDKQTQQARPTDNNPDKAYTRVLVKILQHYQAKDRWPERGSYTA